AAAIDDRPCAFRFPRGEGTGVALPERGTVLPIGRGRILKEGTTVALLSFGARLAECLKAADELAARGLAATVADARFAKPLDRQRGGGWGGGLGVRTRMEEGPMGGFASHVGNELAVTGQLDAGLKFRPMILPDRFIEHDKPERQYEQAGLDQRHIVQTALTALGHGEAAAPVRA